MRIKRVEVDVLDQKNEKVLRRFRLLPPRALVKGVDTKQLFTPAGAQQALSRLLDSIDDNNPNHKYRLVDLGNYKYRLVWDDKG